MFASAERLRNAPRRCQLDLVALSIIEREGVRLKTLRQGECEDRPFAAPLLSHLIETGRADHDTAHEAPNHFSFTACFLEARRGRFQLCFLGTHRQGTGAGIPRLRAELVVIGGAKPIDVVSQADLVAVAPPREHPEHAGFQIAEASAR